MNKPQDLAIRAIASMRGDDLVRARRAWGHLTNAELDETYEQSDKTRREILASYVRHWAECDAAIEWVRGAK